MASRRRKAREVALKVLYQVDLIGSDSKESLAQVMADEVFRPALASLASGHLLFSKPGRILKEDVPGLVEQLLANVLPLDKKNEFYEKTLKTAKEIFSTPTGWEELTLRMEEKVASFAPIETFARNLIEKTLENIKKIDEILFRFADHWSLDRMATLDRAILRFSVCELLYFRDIPINVTINEAIELSKKFSTERSREFINGILDKVQREFHPEKDDPRKVPVEEQFDVDSKKSL